MYVFFSAWRSLLRCQWPEIETVKCCVCTRTEPSSFASNSIKQALWCSLCIHRTCTRRSCWLEQQMSSADRLLGLGRRRRRDVVSSAGGVRQAIEPRRQHLYLYISFCVLAARRNGKREKRWKQHSTDGVWVCAESREFTRRLSPLSWKYVVSEWNPNIQLCRPKYLAHTVTCDV